MPPKKATAAAGQKKTAAAPSHASYKDMIKEAILTLKERNGSSRPAIKKYILANNKTAAASTAVFDAQFNKAIRTGVDKGDFEQPKGSSGTIKLAKKTAAEKPAADKKPAAAKKATGAKSPGRPKKTATDAAPPKKTASKAKAAVPKKATTTKKTATPKPKANTASKRKTPAPAPAIVEQEKVLGKTKSGRVTKGPPKTAAAAKKAAPKKATAKKTATPKKKAEAAAAT